MTAITVRYCAPFLKASDHAHKCAQLGKREIAMTPHDSGLNFPGTRPNFSHARLVAFWLMGAVPLLVSKFPDQLIKVFCPNVEE